MKENTKINRKLKFAVISCGGTIAMEKGSRGVLEPKKNLDEVLCAANISSLEGKMVIPNENKKELFKLDSVNLNPEHWSQIISAVERLQDQSDGIVIIHGTDTMAYSATAVGLALADKIKVPVIFTGAQSPVHETGSDAKANLERSFLVLDQAARDGVAECMIFFGNEAYRGVSSRKRSESDFNGFESPSVRPLYVTDGFGVKETWPSRKHSDILKTKKNIGIEIKNDFSKGVVILSAVPGLEAEVLMAIASKDTTRAIILNSLGAGNIPSLEGDYNLVPAIERITHELGKPVIISSPFIGGDTNLDVYLTGTLAKESGAIDAGKMTAEATLVKTRLLLAQPEFASQDAFKKALSIDFAGETGRF